MREYLMGFIHQFHLSAKSNYLLNICNGTLIFMEQTVLKKFGKI